jgi:fructose/tagatose bisphosphate aldolase
MPLATPAQHAEMLDAAKAGGYAIPAVNVTSSTTLNGAIRGIVTAGSDGIVQVEIAEADSHGVDKMNLGHDGQACKQLGSAGRSLTGHAPRPRRA